MATNDFNAPSQEQSQAIKEWLMGKIDKFVKGEDKK